MVAKKLFETNGDALNQVVTIGKNDYRVIGVYKNKDTAIVPMVKLEQLLWPIPS